MGNSTRTRGGKGAPVPISMHPTKAGGHTVAGMAGVGKPGGGSKGGGSKGGYGSKGK